jgi:hypothetical protein
MEQCGMMNGRGKLLKIRDKPSSLPLSREENKFLSGFQTLRTFITQEKLMKMWFE